MLPSKTKEFFLGIIGMCFHYSAPNGLEYPHGKMVSIVPTEYREDLPYGPMLVCYISFTDGYMGSYSFSADTLLASHFEDMKPY